MLLERVAVALRDTSWSVIPVAPDILDQVCRSDQSPEPRFVISGPGTVFPDTLIMPLVMLAAANVRWSIIPILAVGPTSAFEAIPSGVCSDVITDHFSGSELRYRVSRLLKPVFEFESGRHLVCGPDLSDGRRRVALTAHQRLILLALLRAGGHAVPRDTIRSLFGPSDPGSRSLDMQISRLRVKLALVTNDWPARIGLMAVRGRGYRLGPIADTVP